MTDKEKLNKIIDTLFLGNKAEFARELHISPQTVTNWMNRGISKDGLTSIQKAFPSINPQWLLTGEGEMLNAKETPVAKTTGEANPKEGTKNKFQLDSKQTDRLIPFYDVETTGGYSGTVSASDSGDMVGYIQPGGWFDGHETAAIRHVGDSMTEYPNGCILAVREVLDRHLLVPGRNYVIETSEYRVTKRLQRGHSSDTIMLYSTNTDKYEDGRLIHEPFEISLTDVRRIFSVLGYIVNQAGEFRLIKP